MVEFRNFRGWSRAKSRTTTLDIRVIALSFFKALLGRIPWGMERKGLRAGLVLKDNLLQAQECSTTE